MITINGKKATVVCDNCGKEKFVAEGSKPRRVARKQAHTEGWQFKGNQQIGPLCTKKGVKLEAKAKPAAAKKAPFVRKSTASQKATAAAKKADGGVPTNMGQSIGKLARSAKVAPAPAAE